MQVGILGTLQVRDGARAVDPGPAKQQHVLAMLAIARGRPLAADVIVDQLWGEAAPATALGTLQGYIANLRRALEPERPPRTPARILTSGPTGYVLVVEEDGLDADRFERLAREGRALLDRGEWEAAAAALRDALALWRGEPLAEAAGAEWARTEAVRLTELRLAVSEDLAEARLALGEHDHLVGELQRLLAANPLRERLRGQLMLALYRAGRQADALAVAREGRELLAEELGIDPSPALQTLEADILRQAARLAAPPPARPAPSTALATPAPARPRRAPAWDGGPGAELGIVGRQHEVALLERALARARAGEGQVILISGEPGIGKSRLVEELGGILAPGRPVLGRCVQAEGVPPFWPWVQVLGALPQLSAAGPVASADDLRPAPSARFEQALQVAARLRAASADDVCVVVLEDVHWADPASLDLLHLVTGMLTGDPVAVVATYRDVDAGPGGPLQSVLGLLARHRGVTHVPLRGLDAPAVLALAERTTGAAVDEAGLAALVERTGGNPFFVTELLRWAGTGAWGTSSAQSMTGLPAGIRDVLRLRLAALPDRARHGLAVGAVIGRDFPLRLVEDVVDQDADSLLTGVEAAVEAGLLSEAAPGRFRFAHALVREVLIEGTSAVRRARLHGRLLAAIIRRQGDHAPVAVLAHHAHAAAVGGVEVPDAAALCLRAAQDALGRIAYEEAAAAAGRGLELEGPCAPDARVRCDLLLVRGDALSRLGDLAGAGADVDEAFALASDLGDADRIALAALASAGGGFGLFWSLSWIGGTTGADLALSRLRRAHEAEGTTPELQVAVGALLASTLALSGEPHAADEISAAALAQGRSLGGLPLARALRGRLVARWAVDPPLERIRQAEELIAVAGAHRDAELSGRYFRLVALLELGDIDGCDAELDRFERRAAELRMVEHQLAAGWCRAQRALMEGRVTEAQRLAAELAEPRGGMNATAEVILRSALAGIHGIFLWLAGRLPEMTANAEQVPPEAHSAWALIRALGIAETGDARGAAALLARAMPLDGPTELQGVDAVANAWLQAEVAVLVGDTARARILHRMLQPIAERLVVFSPDATCHGSAELTLGSLAAVCGRLDEAVERLERAIEINARVRARPYEALAHRRLAGVLEARAAPGDAAASAEHAATARAIAGELSLPGIAGHWAVGRAPLPA